jgi:hypothetical protein
VTETFRCPFCGTNRRTLKQWLTCCPTALRAMTQLAQGSDDLHRLTRGHAAPRMVKAAEAADRVEVTALVAAATDDGQPSWEQEWEPIEGSPFEYAADDN